MADLKTARRKLSTRIRQRNNQTRKIAETGGQVPGHHKARKQHVEAIRFLRPLIEKLAQRSAGRMSPNFHVSEFACKDGTPVPKEAYPALRHLCQTYLEPLRARFGSVHITSGYRHRSYNAAIGGASQSVHIYDYPGRGHDAVAADFVCSSGTPAQWAEFLEALNPGGLCPYPGSGFTHVDNRQRVGMAPARWSA